MNTEQQQNTLIQIRTALSATTRPIVLLVEDNEDDALLATRMLTKHGIEIVWTRTREETLAYVRENDTKLVFIDLKLQAGESSLELISGIRGYRPNCWIVVLSGVYAEDSNECKEALRHGAHAVMLKPLTAEKIALIFGSP